MAEATKAQDEAPSSTENENKTNDSAQVVESTEVKEEKEEKENGQTESESKADVNEKSENTDKKRSRDDEDSRQHSHWSSRQGSKKAKAGILSTYDHLEESQDGDEIRRQVEFYFADANLPGDKYLLGLTGGSENKPVELKIIHNFKRMRRFQPFSAVRDAVKASETLDLNDADEITRKVPLDSKFTSDPEKNREIQEEDSINRSIYAKGFGKEIATTQTDVEEFFEPYGPIQAVRMRRAEENGVFKGSVFVEFQTEELAKQFIDLEQKPKWFPKQIGEDGASDKQDEGVDLLIMSKHDYVEKNPKEKDDRSRKQDGQRWNNRGGRGGRGRGGRGGRGGKGDRGNRSHHGRDRDRRRDDDGDHDDEDWRARRDREKGKKNSTTNGSINGQEKHVDENAGSASAAPEQDSNKRKHEESTSEQDSSKKAKTEEA